MNTTVKAHRKKWNRLCSIPLLSLEPGTHRDPNSPTAHNPQPATSLKHQTMNDPIKHQHYQKTSAKHIENRHCLPEGSLPSDVFCLLDDDEEFHNSGITMADDADGVSEEERLLVLRAARAMFPSNLLEVEDDDDKNEPKRHSAPAIIGSDRRQQMLERRRGSSITSAFSSRASDHYSSQLWRRTSLRAIPASKMNKRLSAPPTPFAARAVLVGSIQKINHRSSIHSQKSSGYSSNRSSLNKSVPILTVPEDCLLEESDDNERTCSPITSTTENKDRLKKSVIEELVLAVSRSEKKQDTSKNQLQTSRKSINNYMGEEIEIVLSRDCMKLQRNDTSENEDHDEVTAATESTLTTTSGEKKEQGEEKEFYHHLSTRRASKNFYLGEGFELCDDDLFSMYLGNQDYDPWTQESDADTGRGFDFRVIGTSASDVDAHPHVLSPPQMHSLQSFLPLSKRGESFWLKYSLVRDGADPQLMLRNVQEAQHTLMAMETLDGQVFGAFTSCPWEIQHGYFGTTGESFLWRMKGLREEVEGKSLWEQAHQEADLEVFPYSFQNPVVQICRSDRMAVGGGTSRTPQEISTGELVQPEEFGFGICFDLHRHHLLYASSSPCLTFRSPALNRVHSGSAFELLNLEVWTFSPCISLEEALKMDRQKRFLRCHAKVQ